MTQNFARTSGALFITCALICAVAFILQDDLRAAYWAVLAAVWCAVWLMTVLGKWWRRSD